MFLSSGRWGKWIYLHEWRIENEKVHQHRGCDRSKKRPISPRWHHQQTLILTYATKNEMVILLCCCFLTHLNKSSPLFLAIWGFRASLLLDTRLYYSSLLLYHPKGRWCEWFSLHLVLTHKVDNLVHSCLLRLSLTLTGIILYISIT